MRYKHFEVWLSSFNLEGRGPRSNLTTPEDSQPMISCMLVYHSKPLGPITRVIITFRFGYPHLTLKWGLSKSLLPRSLSEIKRVSVFHAEIQGGCQKWQENDFWEKSSVHSAYTMRVKNFVKITILLSFRDKRICRSISLRFQDKRVLVFHTEIQDGHQKWRENDFWEKLPVCRYPVGPKFRRNRSTSFRFRTIL